MSQYNLIISQASKIKLTPDRLVGIMKGLVLKPFMKQCGLPVSIESSTKFSELHTIELGNWVRIRCGTQILSHVQIKNNVYIGRYCDIGKNTLLEDDVTLADYVCILGDTHEHINPNKRAGKIYSMGQKVIGKGAWIGYRAIILPQVRYVGQGAVIGAGSVVTKDVPNDCIVAGNPAKIITDNNHQFKTESIVFS